MGEVLANSTIVIAQIVLRVPDGDIAPEIMPESREQMSEN